jgi:hypothetical protein
MKSNTYIVKRVRNGFILECPKSIRIYGNAPAIGQEFSSGIFERMPENSIIEIKATVIVSGKTDKEESDENKTEKD